VQTILAAFGCKITYFSQKHQTIRWKSVPYRQSGAELSGWSRHIVGKNSASWWNQLRQFEG
jgi:hypothetical protein